MSNEHWAPGCLGYRGWIPTSVMWGLFHKPWNKDRYQTTRMTHGFRKAAFFFRSSNEFSIELYLLTGLWTFPSQDSREDIQNSEKDTIWNECGTE